MNAVLSAISTASPALNSSAAPMVCVAILSATGAQNLTNPRAHDPGGESERALGVEPVRRRLGAQPLPLEQRNEVHRGVNLHPWRSAGALSSFEPRLRVGEEISPQRLRHGVEDIKRRLEPLVAAIRHRNVRALHGDDREHNLAVPRQRRGGDCSLRRRQTRR